MKKNKKKRATRRTKPKIEAASPEHLEGAECVVVAVGASAGGLEAFNELLSHLEPGTGMAFVFVQHLDPKHESMLPSLLARVSKMPVVEISDGMQLKPNIVHIMPPNTSMSVLHGTLHLSPRTMQGQPMPIDYFFQSLAQDQKNRAIGIILSGTASDGALGIKAIKAEGGVTFAQSEDTAKYFGMPRSAVAAGYVDFVMSPTQIARELAVIASHPYIHHFKTSKVVDLPHEEGTDLNKVLSLLRRTTNVDFTYYKQTTIKRRIFRRMLLHKIDLLSNYLKFLHNTPKEVEELYNDILINVTSFFRDPEMFKTLEEGVFPKILEHRKTDTPLRVWIPGCSTGEEVYSIAISLLEYLGRRPDNFSIQIFATDISDVALERARAGVYMESSLANLSPERLRRFFIKTDGGYQINKSIRDMCVFARQNVAKDPPFSKIDLISCRNVLIYLGPVLQKKVLPIFHYALRPHGMLLLGTSETIGGFSDLFTLVDKKFKIYAKKSATLRLHAFEFTPGQMVAELHRQEKETLHQSWNPQEVIRRADRIALERYSPPGVVVNEEFDILQFRGKTGPFLEPAPGGASLNLLRMAHEGMTYDLRRALHRAKREDARVRYEGLSFTERDKERRFHLEVVPVHLPDTPERYYLVMFEDPAMGGGDEPRGRKKDKVPSIKRTVKEEKGERQRLKEELAATKEYLQAIIEEQEGTNEELRSANEEIQSSNEELQSTNEELETAKEELQSTNEELTTVNEELETRNAELTQLNDDLTNLLSSIHVPILMLGRDMRIRRFTPMAEKMFNVISTDVGRSIDNIKTNLNVPQFGTLVGNVIDTLTGIEQEVQDLDGRWHLLRIRPYTTSDHKIDGVVVFLFEIDRQKQVERSLQLAGAMTNGIFGTIKEALVVLDRGLRIVQANESFYKTFKMPRTESDGRSFFDAGGGEWNIPGLRSKLEKVAKQGVPLEDLRIEHDFKTVGQRKLLIRCQRIGDNSDNGFRLLVAILDRTET